MSWWGAWRLLCFTCTVLVLYLFFSCTLLAFLRCGAAEAAGARRLQCVTYALLVFYLCFTRFTQVRSGIGSWRASRASAELLTFFLACCDPEVNKASKAIRVNFTQRCYRTSDASLLLFEHLYCTYTLLILYLYFTYILLTIYLHFTYSFTLYYNSTLHLHFTYTLLTGALCAPACRPPPRNDGAGRRSEGSFTPHRSWSPSCPCLRQRRPSLCFVTA